MLDSLDLGCGKRKRPGCIGIDISRDSDADFIYDIEQGLPFPDETFQTIYAMQTLEHIHNLIHLMNECWRVLKPGGRMEISVPHKDSDEAYWDPTHVRFFTEATFNYFSDHPHWREYRILYGIKPFTIRDLRREDWQIHIVLEKVEDE
jgi:predicted SAM-dependent methyltransferase